MRKFYIPNKDNQVSRAARNMAIEHNVTFQVIDLETQQVVQQHEGHNAATNTLLTGIAHYLVGDGILNQGYDMLSRFLPRYISLGTMGLISQDCDERGLPIGLGGYDDTLDDTQYYTDPQTNRLCHYISECPGFGADGYDANENMNRPYFGLGLQFSEREQTETINCELINDQYPRVAISYRDIVPESRAEIPKTLDIIYSAMISTGALAQFREEGRDYIFITEAGLWTNKTYDTSGENGLLAGYRIAPPNQDEWDFGTYIEGTYDEEGDELVPPHYELDPLDYNHAQQQAKNQQTLLKNVLRVGKNQVVQVIWKIQIGGLEQLGGMSELYPSTESTLVWNIWNNDEY